jgi:hydrogenase maturation protease
VSTETGRPRAVVIGVGNEYRRDDGVGLQVLSRLRGAVPESVGLVSSDGEPAALIEAWAGADLAVVVDALRATSGHPESGPAQPGRTFRLEIGQAGQRPAATVSSHGLGLGEAIGLAQVLGRMPGRLIVHAVEVGDCGYGVGLTPAVAAAAVAVAAAVLADLGIAGA